MSSEYLHERKRSRTNGLICPFQREEKAPMASRRIVSALNLLTSDEFGSSPDWEDNAFAQELITEYFTGGVISGDETSGESDSDDNTGRLLPLKHLLIRIFSLLE